MKKIFEIALQPGVMGLPIRAKLYFCKALMAEGDGNVVEARGLMARAVAEEANVEKKKKG